MTAFRVALLFATWAGFLSLHPSSPFGSSLHASDAGKPEQQLGSPEPGRVVLRSPQPRQQSALEARPTDASSDAGATIGLGKADEHARSGSASLRVDSHFEDSAGVIKWLLSRGGRILLTDERYRPFAEVRSDGRVGSVTPPLPQGQWRASDVEVRAFLGHRFPKNAAHGVALWPSGIWTRILGVVASSDAIRVETDYRIEGKALAIRVRRSMGPNGPREYPHAKWTLIH